MKRSLLILCCCVWWAVTCFAQSTAIRPDQICNPTCATPNVTWGPGGAGYQIGTTVPWRTDATAGPVTFTTQDLGRNIELTNPGAISGTLPAATGSFSDGAGFTIQVGAGTLTLTAPSGTTVGGVPGTTGIVVGPWQAVSLLSRSTGWYADVSQKPTAGAVVSYSVWNPSDKTSGITLSTTTIANDTATGPSVAGWAGVRGTQSYAVTSANKKVFTLVLTAFDTQNWIGGVGGTAVALTYPGGASPGYGVQGGPSSPSEYQDGAPIGNTAPRCLAYHTFAAGDTLWLAIDFNSGKVYCSTNCTTWANSGNPDTGTGNTTTLSAGTYLPMFGANWTTTAAKAVINTKPTLTGCTNITTYSQWG